MRNGALRIRDVRRRWRDQTSTRLAFLGDERGAVDVGGTTDQCWVRFVEGVDGAGVQQLSAPVVVRVGTGVNYINAWGAAVRVGRDDYGRWEIKRNDPNWLAERGISARVLNRARPDTQFIALQQLSLFRSFPVGTADQPSDAVTLYPLLHEVDGEFRFWRGTETDKIDLSPFIPPVGLQRLVLVCYNVVERQPTVFAANAISLDDAIGVDQLNEAAAQKTDDDLPSTCYVLRGGERVTSRSLSLDARQLINMPQLVGDPDEIARPIRIHTNRVLEKPTTLVVRSRLIVEGRVLVGSAAAGGGGGGIAVQEIDGAPNVSDVTRLIVPNDTLTDLGGGSVRLDIGVPPAQFVLGAPSAAIPTAIVIPGMRANADRIRVSGGIVEEYDTSATNLTWSPAPLVVNSNVIASHLFFRGVPPALYSGLRPWVTTGDFDARTKMSIGAHLTATDLHFAASYLTVGNATLPTNNATTQEVLCGALLIRSAGIWQLQFEALSWSGTAYTTQGMLLTSAVTACAYFRITRVGTTLACWFSADGLVWSRIAQFTYTLTVAQIGYRLIASGVPQFEMASDWLWTSV